MKKLSLKVPLLVGVVTLIPLPALADTACDQVASIFDDAVEEWPDLLSTARIKPRMAVVKIGTSAGVNVRYAVDAGWTDAEMAPIVALRDTRERDYDETFTKALVPGILKGHLTEIAAMMAVKCPDTELTDISGLSTVYPES